MNHMPRLVHKIRFNMGNLILFPNEASSVRQNFANKKRKKLNHDVK